MNGEALLRYKDGASPVDDVIVMEVMIHVFHRVSDRVNYCHKSDRKSDNYDEKIG